MSVFISFAFIFFTAAVFAALKISAATVRDTLKEKQTSVATLRDRCAERKKENKAAAFMRKITFALETMGQIDLFYYILLLSALLIIIGLFIGMASGNIWLSVAFSIIFAFIPFVFVKLQYADYKEMLMDELETGLSLITSTIIRTDNVLSAVKENIKDINKPLKDIFIQFVFAAEHNIAVPDAIDVMKQQLDNAVWKDWCDALKNVSNNRMMKASLRPIVDRLATIKLAKAEAKVILYDAMSEFKKVVGICLCFIAAAFFAAPLAAMFGFDADITNLNVTLFSVVALLFAYSSYKVFLLTKDVDYDKF